MMGADLKLLRIEAGLTQIDLAEKLGITQGMLSRIERGGTTTTEVVERWAEVCGGSIQIEGRAGIGPEIAKLIAHAKKLSADDVVALMAIARGLPVANATFKAGLVAMFADLAPSESQAPDQLAERRQQG